MANSINTGRFKTKSIKAPQLIAVFSFIVNAALGIVAEILFVLHKKIEAESPPILPSRIGTPK